MDFKCYKCGIVKSKKDFYKNNYNRCKECKRIESREGKISKNDVFEILNILFEKINSNEIYIREIFTKLNNMEKIIVNNNIDDKIVNINDTIKNIEHKNKVINNHIDNIIKYGKKDKINIDDNYEKRLKEILED